MTKKLLGASFFSIFLFLFFSPISYAKTESLFVTVVNPVRISSYTKDSAGSLQGEYDIYHANSVPATWLLTFDVLKDKKMVEVIKKMDAREEFGILLEVTKSFASEAGVIYHDSGFWHHAGSLFLSGYTQDERKALIDKVFSEFKDVFGYYPKSVGSWWTDAFSLTYIKEKYGITANLVCSDQFSTDGYEIWGQPWMIPYYPSKFYTAVPATSESIKLDVVNVQWAFRDPLNGYYNSLYSTQDYLVAPTRQDINYYQKMVNFYLNGSDKNGFGQITLGLEADLGASSYNQNLLVQVSFVKKLALESGVNLVTMKDFANWYRETYSDLSPASTFEGNDLLGKNIKAVWEQDNKHRLFYTVDLSTNEITVRDLRFYNSDLIDPYYVSPNRSFTLSVNIPSVVDEVSMGESVKKLPPDTKNIVKNFPSVSSVPRDGYLLKGFSSEAIHFFKQKKAILDLIKGVGWQYFKRVDYQIPQGEIYALYKLAALPKGKVLVFDGECLQCEYHTKLKPPFMANIRSYVEKYGKHPIVYNSSVFNAETITEAKKEFDKLSVKYVYLVKFEGYSEKLPFSPGDLDVEKIFSNANAEIWEVKE